MKRFSFGLFFAAVTAGALVYLCRAALIPLALALLFGLLLSGPVERMHAYRIPRGLSAMLMLLLISGAVWGAVDLLWNPAQQWYSGAPQTLKIIKGKVKPVAVFLQRVEELRSDSDPMALTPAAPPASGAGNPSNTSGLPSLFIDATRNVLVSLTACIVMTLFLLAGGPPMVARMTVALVDDLHVFHVMEVIDQIRAEVARFYLTQALLNIALGSATAALMSWFGMPSPMLWGAVAAILTFIPYAGSAAVLLILTVVALVTFDSPARVVGVAASYLALSTIAGQVVQPLLVGQRLEINPLIVFLSLWFGSLFWGIVGVVIAMPTLLALKVISQNSSNSKRLRAFLGPNDKTFSRTPWSRWLAIRRLRRSKASGLLAADEEADLG